MWTLSLIHIYEAVRLLNLSASKGFAPAQFILGRLLYKGEVIPKDIKKAVEWLDLSLIHI